MSDEKDKPDLRERTLAYALRVIRLSSSLTGRGAESVIGHQLLRSGTSVGAHYREAHRSRSSAEFISKLETALQELDETQYWMELLLRAELVAEAKLADLMKETNELIAIFVASVKTAKTNRTN
jgi:four helix bundle protein